MIYPGQIVHDRDCKCLFEIAEVTDNKAKIVEYRPCLPCKQFYSREDLRKGNVYSIREITKLIIHPYIRVEFQCASTQR